MSDHNVLQDVGFQGFTCPHGNGNVGPDYCEDGCDDRCMPLPIILECAGHRGVTAGKFSVTEIYKPYLQATLMRTRPFWTDPYNQLFMVRGSAVHSIMERGAARIKDKDDYIIEKHLSRTIEFPQGEAILTGIPDLIINSEKTMYDYKDTKAYKVKMLKKAEALAWIEDDYFIQLNVYRWLGYPEVERLKIICLIKDFSNQVALKDGLLPVEEINVPVADIEEVKRFVLRRLDNLLLYEQGEAIPPTCGPKDRWTNDNRCHDYCPVNQYCDYFRNTYPREMV